MPIEFRCTGCKKLLRTKDDSAGKQARCPECGTLLNVPGTRVVPNEPTVGPAATGTPATTPPAVAARQATTESYSPQQDSDNPYMSPRTSHLDDSQIPVPDDDLRSTPLHIGETLTRTWRILWHNFGRCFLATLIFVIITTVPRLPISGYLLIPAMQRGNWAAALGWWACDSLLTILIYAHLGAGLRLFMLKIARGEEAPLVTLFKGGKYYIPLLIGQIFFWMSFFVGILALFVGAVVAVLFFWAYGYLIVDRNLGVVDAFRTSARITAGNRFAVLATFFIALIPNVLIFIIALIPGSIISGYTYDIAAFFFMPYLLLLSAVMYLSLTDQPMAEIQET